MDPKNCFICDCVCLRYNKNLFEIKSKYSDTRLSELIVKILGDFPFEREYSIECDENAICNDCLNKINEYDLACLTAKRVEDELRELVVKTAMSHATECDAPIESNHQLFTESTETFELKTDIKMEEPISLDYYESIEASDEESASDEFELEDPELPQSYERVQLKDEPEFVQSRNKHRKSKNVRSKEATVNINCYTCQYCALDLLDEKAMADHRELHEKSSLPFECVLCSGGKTFKSKASLVRHMRIHSGLKFYKCERCSKEFIHKSSYQWHILAHDDIKNQKNKRECNTCKRLFRSISHLNRHVKVHTGEKKWACNICHHTTAQRSNLKIHMHVHESNSDKGRWLCMFCSKKFTRKSKFEEHLLKNHEAATPHTAIGNKTTEKISHTHTRTHRHTRNESSKMNKL